MKFNRKSKKINENQRKSMKIDENHKKIHEKTMIFKVFGDPNRIENQSQKVAQTDVWPQGLQEASKSPQGPARDRI